MDNNNSILKNLTSFQKAIIITALPFETISYDLSNGNLDYFYRICDIYNDKLDYSKYELNRNVIENIIQPFIYRGYASINGDVVTIFGEKLFNDLVKTNLIDPYEFEEELINEII